MKGQKDLLKAIAADIASEWPEHAQTLLDIADATGQRTDPLDEARVFEIKDETDKLRASNPGMTRIQIAQKLLPKWGRYFGKYDDDRLAALFNIVSSNHRAIRRRKRAACTDIRTDS